MSTCKNSTVGRTSSTPEKQLAFSTVASRHDSVVTQQLETLDGIMENFLQHQQDFAEKDGPALIPAIFKEQVTPENTRVMQRLNENVIEASIVGLDFDGVALDQPIADFVKDAVGADCIVHTTYSHGTPGKPGSSFRVLIVLSRPVAPEEYRRVWKTLHVMTGGISDKACSGPNRLFYTPRRPHPEATKEPVLEAIRGYGPLDVDQILECSKADDTGEVESGRPSDDHEALRAEAHRVATAQKGSRNTALNTAAFLSGQLIARGELDESTARARLREASAACGLPSPEAEQTITSGLTAGQKKPSSKSSADRSGAQSKARRSLNIFISALMSDPRWDGVLRYNELKQVVEFAKPAPFDTDLCPEPPAVGDYFTDAHDCLLVMYAERHHNILNPALGWAKEGASVLANANRYHPVKEYIDSLKWDGTPRLDTWLAHYLGACDTPYTRKVGPWWLISGIARVYQPGCKVDYALILEGPQGLRKSTVFSILGGAHAVELKGDLGSKDSQILVQGAWIVELSELDALRKSEATATKSFLTTQIDRYRPPYGRRVIESPRRCIFGGSTNASVYLKDSTGNRRFWPVACRKIDQDALRIDRDQLWAEAKARYDAGELWYPASPEDHETLGQEQELRREEDSWEAVIDAWLSDHTGDYVTTSLVLQGALGLAPKDVTKSAEVRVTKVLSALGWTKGARRRDGRTLVSPWYPPVTPA